ncbi:hypothetical protein GCM10022209_46020 [Chitinophaga oryziterrae]
MSNTMAKHLLTIEIEANSRKEAEDKLSGVMLMLGVLYKTDQSSVIGNAVKLWVLWEAVMNDCSPKISPYHSAVK